MYGIFMESWVILKNYVGQGRIFILFLVSLGYLLIVEKNKKVRSLIVYAPAAILVVFLCPLFRKGYVRLLGEGVTYYRVLWLLPVSVTVAYAACRLIGQIKNKIGKRTELVGWIGAIAMAALIVAAGRYTYGSQFISKAENAYHIPQEVIDICEMIKPKEGEHPYVCATFPGDLVYYVRQYDTHIWLSYGRDMVEPVWGYFNDIYSFIEKEDSVRSKLLLATTRNQGERSSSYIVLRKNKPIDIPPEELGLIPVGETANYKVYKDPVVVEMLRETRRFLEEGGDGAAPQEEESAEAAGPDANGTEEHSPEADAAKEDGTETGDAAENHAEDIAPEDVAPEEPAQEDTRSQDEIDLENSLQRSRAAAPYEKDIMPELRPYYEINNRVVGYIRIEGTDVDCPVLQTIEDYEFYLTHDIVGNESKQGCIILDPDSEIGIGTKESGYLEGYGPSTNQLVHGHNMKSGTMFGSLDSYAKESYAGKYPLIEFDSLYEKRTYEVVLAFYSKVYPEDEDVFKYYNFNQADTEEEFQDWYEHVKELALYHRDIGVEFGDEMITLSTCAYQEQDGRFAVVGKRIE